jgi:alpha-L-rhamnosidase
VLGKNEDVEFYTELLGKIKEAFLREYLTPNGRLVSSTQTAYTLALNFDMLPLKYRDQAAKRLSENITSYGNHLTTGFLGTPYLCHVLTRFGYNDVAYKLLLQEKYPSWLYPVKMGATTIWERWDGQKPDSTFQTTGMNSFNHYSYGAIGDWMYRQMVGLDTYEDGVGYKHSKVQPHIGGGFTQAEASLQTYYGKLSSGWKVEGDTIYLDVVIPANTTSSVFFPTRDIDLVSENGVAVKSLSNIILVGQKNNYFETSLGSGEYHFVIKSPKNKE